MALSTWITYFLLPAFRPMRTLDRMVREPNKIRYAITIYVFLGVIYTAVVILAYSRGVGAAVEPFIKIPAKEYYFWQMFYQMPFFLIINILFAGAARLLGLAFKGTGNFEDLFCLICSAMTFPMFITMWLPETFGFVFFPGQAIFPVWLDVSRQLLGILWPLVIAGIGTARIEKIHLLAGLLIALLAFIPCAALMVVFIR